ncbi:hypothetical protein GQ43DRAFT_429405 [Delitschia confertaspora ATCC 74209]|uniref:Uncharacterized protein n=1 Tax=Delitschia confertaspora ATCC 74209 TaxID=1513339 RepID=A0A9P4MVD5_9PLEO|nr:hypothetical protein GQ43DRAFT_429405 [Delitschia confertaspora ATCC 74209]
MDESPNCAICNGPATPECPCESDRLQIAVKQAEDRAMQARLQEIRDWVVSHARQHILNAFERLSSARKQSTAQYLGSLPYYSVYVQYSGRPPIHPMHLAPLQAQISEAHADLKRGIDADWRSSVLRYPEVLDYFYSLVELRLPSPTSPRVMEPPFATAGYADAGYGHVRVKKEKKKRRERSEREGSAAPPDYAREHMYTVAGRMRGPPPVPTPPIQPGYPTPPPNAYYNHGY